MGIKNYIKDNNCFKKISTMQLKNLARNLKIFIKDIKQVGKYRIKLRKRIMENIK